MWCGCLGPFAQSRRDVLRGIAATLAVAGGGCASAAPKRPAVGDAAGLLDETTSIDLHSHPGLIRGLGRTTTMETQIERMAAGRVRASLVAAVADSAVLTVNSRGRIYAQREPQPGELYRTTYAQLERVRTRITAGALLPVHESADLDRARRERRHAAILAVEGADFLEGRLERVEEAYTRGIRSIQLVHYRVNELGDIQTEAVRHGGLTPFGRDVIREMNRLGMLVDVAHGTLDLVRAAAEASSKPFVLSHTVVDVPGLARAVSREHARLVAQRGGVVGVFPVAFGGPGFSGYIDHVSRMADAVGIDHVAIGTDMDGIPLNSTFDDYAEWPSIATALLARGYGRADVAKVMGDNVARVLTATIG